MRYKLLLLLTLSLCISFLLGLAGTASAEIKLTILSSDGGSSLNLGRVDMPSLMNKEVRVRITSTDGSQYQVFQRMNVPLQNEKGEILDRNVILTSALTDSNAYGTLYIQDEQQVTSSDQIVYTSSQDGMSDEFTLVYEVDQEKLDAQGNFMGEILYTVRNVSGGSPDEEIINVYLDASTSFEYETEFTSGLKTLTLNSLRNTDDPESFIFKFSNNYGSLRVYQEIDTAIVDPEGDEMDWSLVTFRTSGGESGELAHQDLTSLEPQRILIYETRQRNDEFMISYYLDKEKIKSHKAGIFSGRIKYIVQTDMIEENIDSSVEVNVEPYFQISLTYPEEGMAFKNLLPGAPVQMKELIVTVDSNIQRPYVVTQKVNAGGLSNADGYQIEKQYFTLSEELLSRQSGKVVHKDFVPVEEGETQIFYSDKQGSPSRFRVYYRLEPYLQIHAGDYTAAMVFSLEEI